MNGDGNDNFDSRQPISIHHTRPILSTIKIDWLMIGRTVSMVFRFEPVTIKPSIFQRLRERNDTQPVRWWSQVAFAWEKTINKFFSVSLALYMVMTMMLVMEIMPLIK